MELRELRTFVAVAEEGGFGRAAARLGVVQSAVSRQVARLEEEWGTRLFERTTRRVRLSGAGERLLPEARAVLAAAGRAARVAADITAGDDGVLRLGGVHGPGDRLDRVLADLTAGAPGLRVALRSLPVTERLAAVRAGELDAALVRAVDTAPGLALLPLWTDPLYAALPQDHPLAAQPSLDIAQLAGLPLRLAPRGENPPFHDLVTSAVRAPAGPPFTGLRETLTAIGTDREPSWTVFYDVRGLPAPPRVAVRPLAGPAVTTSLAVPPGPPTPQLRELLRALRAAEDAHRP
ncbi:LysR family transcriptional regulator [Streptomyces sp. NPDC058955]|uniref:LysR family transcriptional regulator n=1 Tax=unclassified Streptomyces TaxID=2593676 RepID=UPI00365F25F5